MMEKEKTKVDVVECGSGSGEEAEAVTLNDRQLAVMCHILGMMTSVFVPLVYVLSKKGDSEFLIHHETQALNFQITMLLAMALAVWLDMFVFCHAYLIPVVLISDVTLSVTAAIRANESLLYIYPLAVPFIRRRNKKN